MESLERRTFISEYKIIYIRICLLIKKKYVINVFELELELELE